MVIIADKLDESSDSNSDSLEAEVTRAELSPIAALVDKLSGSSFSLSSANQNNRQHHKTSVSFYGSLRLCGSEHCHFGTLFLLGYSLLFRAWNDRLYRILCVTRITFV